MKLNYIPEQSKTTTIITKEEKFILELTKNEAAAVACIVGTISNTKFIEIVESLGGLYCVGSFGVDVGQIVQDMFFHNLYSDLKCQLDAQPIQEYTETDSNCFKTPSKEEVKLGQEYQHNDGSKYIVAQIGQNYSLICYYSPDDYLGKSYGISSEYIDEIFGCNKDYFELIG